MLYKFIGIDFTKTLARNLSALWSHRLSANFITKFTSNRIPRIYFFLSKALQFRHCFYNNIFATLFSRCRVHISHSIRNESMSIFVIASNEKHPEQKICLMKLFPDSIALRSTSCKRIRFLSPPSLRELAVAEKMLLHEVEKKATNRS